MTSSIAPFTPPAGSLDTDDHSLDLINDNSKRIVSMRINTSDFGRVKAMAKRLKARDSEVLRFVLRLGLAEMSALCRRGATPQEMLGAFALHGPALVDHFELNEARLDQLLNADRGEAPVTLEDLELLVVAAQSTRLLAFRLQELTGTAVVPEDARTFLRTYLEAKYSNPDSRVRSDAPPAN
jgi:hypothetical protein